MSQNQSAALPGTEITLEQAQSVGGGDCSVNDYIRAVEEFKNAYDNLVEFTSYVIERVAGP